MLSEPAAANPHRAVAEPAAKITKSYSGAGIADLPAHATGYPISLHWNNSNRENEYCINGFDAFCKGITDRIEKLMRLSAASLVTAAALASIVFVPLVAHAADDIAVSITNHKFEPSEINIPANKRVTITVTNNDATPEEFESHALKVEKVIPGKSKGTVRIGPLKPGHYPFVGEYHEDTAKGAIVVE
jgi:plastocyanin